MPTLLLQLNFLQSFVVAAGVTGQSYATIRWLLAYRDALIPTTVSFISNVTGALSLINPVYTKNYNPAFLTLLGWVVTGSTPVLYDIFEKLKQDRTDTWAAAGTELQGLINSLTRAYSGCVQTSVWGRGVPDVPFDVAAIAGTIANVMGLGAGGVPLPYWSDPDSSNPSTSSTTPDQPLPPQPAPGTPVPTLSIVSGDGQSVSRTGTKVQGGIAVFTALSVLLRDSTGKPMAGQSVSWVSPSHPQAMAVQMDPGGAPFTTITNADGIATLDRMSGASINAYYADGAFTVAATAGSAVATFHLAVVPPRPQLSLLAGDGQTVALAGSEVAGGCAYFAPLTVLLRDAAGNPQPNQNISWASPTHPTAMAVQMDPGGYPFTTTTDADGIAVLNRMGDHSVRAYYASGAFTIVASSNGASATFNLTVAPAGSAGVQAGTPTISVVSGDGQDVVRSGNQVPGGVAVFAALSVVVRDSAGRPMPNQSVSWVSPSHPVAMTVQMDPTASSVTTMTDGNGIATLNRMNGASINASGAEGTFVIMATTAGVTTSFHLAVVPAAAAQMSVVAGDGQIVSRSGSAVPGGMATFAPLSVALHDGAGKPQANETVTWASPSHPQAMAVQMDPGGYPFTTTTGGDGIATLNRMGGHSVSAYYATGPITIVASAGAARAIFHLTVA